jgi:hypothetical protein
MKLRKLEFKQILKLHLLKHRTYEQPSIKNNSMSLITDLTLNETIFNLKKALQIIFQYHIRNKRILFVGVPTKLETKINKATNHVAISQDMNMICSFIYFCFQFRWYSYKKDSFIANVILKNNL